MSPYQALISIHEADWRAWLPAGIPRLFTVVSGFLKIFSAFFKTSVSNALLLAFLISVLTFSDQPTSFIENCKRVILQFLKFTWKLISNCKKMLQNNTKRALNFLRKIKLKKVWTYSLKEKKTIFSSCRINFLKEYFWRPGHPLFLRIQLWLKFPNVNSNSFPLSQVTRVNY